MTYDDLLFIGAQNVSMWLLNSVRAVQLKHFHTTTIVANNITVNGVSVVSIKPAGKTTKQLFLKKKKKKRKKEEEVVSGTLSHLHDVC